MPFQFDDNNLGDGVWVIKENHCHRLCDPKELEKDEEYYTTLALLKYKYRDDMAHALMELWSDYVHKTYHKDKDNEIVFSLPSINECVEVMLRKIAKEKVKEKLETL